MSTEPANETTFGNRSEASKPIVPKSASEALRPEQGTPPPRRSQGSRNQFVVFMNFVMSTVIFVVLIAGLAVYLGKREFSSPGPAQSTEMVMVKPSTSVSEIASS